MTVVSGFCTTFATEFISRVQMCFFRDRAGQFVLIRPKVGVKCICTLFFAISLNEWHFPVKQIFLKI